MISYPRHLLSEKNGFGDQCVQYNQYKRQYVNIVVNAQVSLEGGKNKVIVVASKKEKHLSRK